MRQFLFRVIAIMLCLAVSACGTPRGAGFQSEVLAASNASKVAEGEDAEYDFAVFEVTRQTLPLVANWPSLGGTSHQWITRQSQPASLIIAPGDKLALTIWDAEENSLLAGQGQRATPLQEIEVDTSGRIFVPFIGELKVSGMSPSTARSRIEEDLIRTIPSAQVQLAVVPGRANTANLVSGVSAPGVYPLADRDMKLLDLIALGGGVAPGIVNPQVRLIRGDKVYGMSVNRLFAEPRLDTTLRGGDSVIVREDERYFLSLGATGTEALHVFPKEDVSALDAMSIVGGVSDTRANPQGILILREYSDRKVRSDGSGPPQQRVVFTLDLTTADGLFSAGKFEIQPNDLVYATESALGPALTIFGVLTSVASVRP